MRALLRFLGLRDGVASRPAAEPTTLGHGIRIKGEVRGDGSLLILGAFEGDIVLNGTLEIGPPGRVEGNVTAHEIVIAGVMRGNLSADTRVDILPSGSLTGSVRTGAFNAADGAIVKGEVWVEPPAASESSA